MSSKRWFFAFAMGALALAVFAAFAARGDTARAGGPPTGGLDHFKCYLTLGKPVAERVELEDQFDAAAGIREDARVLLAVRFCNPVEKLHAGAVTPIRNPDAHLKLYFMVSLKSAAPPRVQVTNQFGTQDLDLGRAIFLAVPTQKLPHPPPNGLDHFKCYLARGNPVSETVGLLDQFKAEPRVRVFSPVLLCNPVVKFHAGTVTPILNPLDHLVCYQIRTGFFGIVSHLVRAVNQFGHEDLRVLWADLLCVPSQKFHLTPGG